MAGEREGQYLLGPPTFEEMGKGRVRCVETGHELPSRDMADSYGRSKACRLALIDAALRRNTPPLNMFTPHPISKSKLVCKLTGDTINKSEEHIWKHVTGKRFQNKLNQKEAERNTETPTSNGVAEKNASRDRKKASKLAANGHVEKNAKRVDRILKLKQGVVKENQTEDTSENDPLSNELTNRSSDSEEPDFWFPPIGSRWDFDNGKDRWEACAGSSPETDDVYKDTNDDAEARDISARTKRMSIAVGPSSFASRKKKSKKSSAD